MRLVTQVLEKLQIGITVATGMNCHYQDGIKYCPLTHSSTSEPSVPSFWHVSIFLLLSSSTMYFEHIVAFSTERGDSLTCAAICQESPSTSLHVCYPHSNPKCYLFHALVVLSSSLSTFVHASTSTIISSPCS